MLNKKNGFTLIELLVVVLIIGVLAAIALPQYLKAVEKSRASEAMQILSAIQRAQEVYYMTNNTYTNDWKEIEATFNLKDGADSTKKETDYFIYTLITGDTYNYVTAYRGWGAQNKYRFELYYRHAGSNSNLFACVPQAGYEPICEGLGGRYFTKVGLLNAYKM